MGRSPHWEKHFKNQLATICDARSEWPSSLPTFDKFSGFGLSVFPAMQTSHHPEFLGSFRSINYSGYVTIWYATVVASALFGGSSLHVLHVLKVSSRCWVTTPCRSTCWPIQCMTCFPRPTRSSARPKLRRFGRSRLRRSGRAEKVWEVKAVRCPGGSVNQFGADWFGVRGRWS